MLKLLNITKDYKVGDQVVHALREIDLEFGESGFVSILGQSGCGKTTLMNVIGGLDRYTTGDVVIDGVSTKDYSERDWNTYRNDVVGFVFQSYNLIPHMTVLANVELALTLSGIKGAERKERSLAMLEKVGLKEQAHKRPNQLSGGQCQRVAIARALFLYRARRDISRRRHYASCDGEKERKKQGNVLISTEIELFDDNFTQIAFRNGEKIEEAKLYYKDMVQWKESKNYFFLYPNKVTAYPIDKKGLGEDGCAFLRNVLVTNCIKKFML